MRRKSTRPRIMCGNEEIERQHPTRKTVQQSLAGRSQQSNRSIHILHFNQSMRNGDDYVKYGRARRTAIEKAIN